MTEPAKGPLRSSSGTGDARPACKINRRARNRYGTENGAAPENRNDDDDDAIDREGGRAGGGPPSDDSPPTPSSPAVGVRPPPLPPASGARRPPPPRGVRDANEQPPTADDPPPPILAFGEALLSYRPLAAVRGAPPPPSSSSASRPRAVLESAGGSELNVAVACSRSTDAPASFASVLPFGPLGDAVLASAVDAGVDVGPVVRVGDGGGSGEVGTVHVLNGGVHYQRRHSAFAAACASSSKSSSSSSLLDWPSLVRGRSWLVASGITAALGPGPLEAWRSAIRAAAADDDDAGVRVAVDFNHRPALGMSVEELWTEAVGPEATAGRLDLLVVSEESGRRILSVLDGEEEGEEESRGREGGGDGAATSSSSSREPDGSVPRLLSDLRERLGGSVPLVAACVKDRVVGSAEDGTAGAAGTTAEKKHDDVGKGLPVVVRRCSHVAHEGGVASSSSPPSAEGGAEGGGGGGVLHAPAEPLGGGDAWLAGFLSVLARDRPPRTTGGGEGGEKDGRGGRARVVAPAYRRDVLVRACRRGDLLAALSQSTPGDLCEASPADLSSAERRFPLGTTANLLAPKEFGTSKPVARAAAVAADEADPSDLLESKLRSCRVVPVIVPPPGPDGPRLAALAASALVDGGLPVVEVAFRTGNVETDAAAVAAAVEAVSKKGGTVGAGTVLTIDQARRARDAGAAFVVCPGFDEKVVRWCLEDGGGGIAVVPGVATATEATAALACGVRLVKFFPAEQMGGVDAVRALSGPFGDRISWMPTGGVSKGNVREYLRLKAVLCCGGTWMAPSDAVSSGDAERMRRLAREAAAAASVLPPWSPD